MDHCSSTFKAQSILLLLLLSVFVISCQKKIPPLPKSDLLTLPSMTDKDFQTTLYDSGRVQLKLFSPLLEQFEKAIPPMSEFKKGIKVILYNGKDTAQATVTSKYAKCTDNNLWELRDSVMIINDKGEKLETELLFWNQEKDIIYTDRFVKITSVDQITQGVGFESDSHLIRRKILKVTAEIYPPDEE